MATRGATGSTRVDSPRGNGVRGRIAERNHETKAAFKTTEFFAFLGTIAAVLVAAALVDEKNAGGFGASQAWLYVTLLTFGYMLSRGIAKSGSREPYSPGDDR